MKKVLSLILCLCMLAGTVVLFASCGGKSVALGEYKVVFATNVSAYSKDKAKELATVIKQSTGTSPETEGVKSTDEVTKGEGKEILVGNTNRPESADVLGSIDGHGYAIVPKGDKIVINGTTPLLTAMAVDYFMTTYLSAPAAEVKVEKTIVSDMAMMELDTQFKVVYDNALDATTSKGSDGNNQNVFEGVNKPYNYDFPVYAAMYIAKPAIQSATGLKLSCESDTIALPKEILVGNTIGREEMGAFNAQLDAFQYGLSVKNNNIILGAQTDTNLRNAIDLLEDLLRDSIVMNGDKKTAILPAEFSTICDASNPWLTDFPRPSGDKISLSGTSSVGDGGHLFIYSGDGISLSAFNTYCASLEAAGYARYMENEAEGSHFITYKNAEKNHVLHVMYAAYKYASPLYENIKTVEKSIRITSMSAGRINLPEQNMLTQDLSSYTKKLNSRVTAVSLNWMPGVDENGNTVDEMDHPDRGYGNAFIVTLEDGRLVVIDGGFINTFDQTNFYQVMRNLYVEANGHAPTPEDPIRVAAWIMTHDHGDHSQIFSRFVNTYCTNGEVAIDYVLGSFVDNEEIFNAVDSGLAVRQLLQGNTFKNLPHPTKFIRVFTGQKFYIANCEFEVLCTHEDVFPNRIARFNDTTTVIRTTITHTDGNGNASANSKTSMLWLGDAEVKESASMVGLFGEYLESDMIQMSHHAGGGTTYTLYRNALGTGEDSKGKIVLVPQSRKYYKSKIKLYLSDTKETGWGCTAQVVQNNSTQYVIIADDCDGIKMINTTIVIDENGANMEMKSASNPNGVYSLTINTKLTWTNDILGTSNSLIKKY